MRQDMTQSGNSSPNDHPRSNWASAFKKMAKNSDDCLLDDGVMSNSWDDKEWVW